MLILAKLLVVALVVFLFYVGLRLGEARKRARERELGDFGELASRRLGRREELAVAGNPAEAIGRLVAYAEKRGARVTVRTDTQMIGFTGCAGDSKFKGMLHTEPMDMPLRLAAQARREGPGSRVEVLLDEDYGFQMFAGPAKHAFREKYRVALERTLEEVRALLLAG
jgi:hypothetical protein